MTGTDEFERTFLVADLSGYTALTEAHGGLQAADVVGRFVELVDASLHGDSRREEVVGDEVLIASEGAEEIVRSSLELCDAVDHEPDFPTVRAGIHRGAVIRRHGNYFGSALNLVSRVAAHAVGGQILCTEEVVPAAKAVGAELRSLGEQRFRNVLDPVRIYEIVRRGHESAALVDPVCRMQVRPESAPAMMRFGSTTYYFCSLDCARKFAATPDRYARR